MNHHSAVDKAVRLARLVGTEGFSDMTADEVNNLIECHSNPLTDEDLEEMTRSASEEEEESASDEGDQAEERGLTLHNLQDLFNIAKGLQKRAQEVDDNMVRAVEFSNRIDDVMAVYKSIFVQKKKQRSQLPITMFLVRRKPEERPPAATTPPPEATTPTSAQVFSSPYYLSVRKYVILRYVWALGTFIKERRYFADFHLLRGVLPPINRDNRGNTVSSLVNKFASDQRRSCIEWGGR